LVQQKFNLLREESEGYSKLVTELTRSELSESNVESVIGTVQSLVGYFDLDPNRVLDLVLEAYEHNQVATQPPVPLAFLFFSFFY
jgi:THO complex subunit 2